MEKHEGYVKKTRGQNKYIFLNSIIPILISGLIYYLFFPNNVFSAYIDKMLKTGIHIHLPQNIIINILRGYMFDFVWAYSFSVIIVLFIEKNKVGVLLQILIPVITGIGYEFLQYFGITGGTFDVLDIFFELIASILGAININKIHNSRRKL